jgi:predicted Zn-dependent protease
MNPAQEIALVQRVGAQLASRSVAARSPYRFSFHVLADSRTVNAFALPGGPVFITEGLLRLLRTEGELADRPGRGRHDQHALRARR